MISLDSSLIPLIAWILLGAAAITGFVLVLLPNRRLPLSRRRPGVTQHDSALRHIADVATGGVEKAMAGRGSSFSTIMEDAGVSIPVKDLIVITGSVSLALLAAGLLAGQGAIGLLLAILCPIGMRMWLSAKADQRRRKFGKQLEETLQMMAGSMRAGYSLPQAVATIAQEAADPVREEFARVTNETRVGRPLIEALDEVAERMRNEDFYWISQAIGINREVGGNLADVLDGVSKTIRERGQMKRQVAALAADGKLSAIILVAMPFAVALFLAVVSPEYLSLLITDPLGWIMIGAGVLMLGIGSFWLSKVINLKY